MKYCIENFKSVIKSGWIDVKPITILIGANSTGKSSVIQPFLILGQTLANSKSEVGLKTNGHYIRSGNYKDLIHNHIIENKLKISFDFGAKCTEDCDLHCLKEKKLKSIQDTEPGDLSPSKYNLTFSCGQNLSTELESVEIRDCLNRRILKRSRLKSNKFSLQFVNDFIDEDKVIVDAIKNQQPENFIFDDSDIIRQTYQKKDSKGKTEKIALSTDSIKYLNTTSYIQKKIINTLSRIKYIGPLRETPKRLYEYNKDDFDEVGVTGENTASVLYINKDNKIKKNQLVKWLKLFKFSTDINVSVMKDHPELFTLEFKPQDSDFFVNFSDNCSGLSQLLPLLVQSIYSEDNEIIISEQPELHLNPYLETILADFIIEMSNNKRNYIIETHSEHFFLRLRTHIKKGSIKSEDVAIYYSETIDGQNKFKKIIIDKNGDFPNNDWPIGFFEQSLAENLMFATARKIK